MSNKKTAKLIANILYSIWVLIVLCLLTVFLFLPNRQLNPDAMIPFTLRDQAFVFAAVFSVPMIISCAVFYRINKLREKPKKNILFLLVFLPGFICAACAFFIIGVILLGMINSFLLN